ncbi:glycogen debranching N-terminal domain-containing protein [Luteimonas cucumeris]|uniref:amylo-alpha-1,6-glucosidase n=1 Tax=Luteimonas cucumeris TaxID=985012 RepID=UPI001A7E6988|nr:glycogen debranching N-terminal domain-containing protein [Luteimonas cucumeris]
MSAHQGSADAGVRRLVRLRTRDEATHIGRGDTVFSTRNEGFVEGEREQGLFVHRTRLLSLYRCFVSGRRPIPVTLSQVRQDSWLGYYIAAAPSQDGDADSPDHVAQNALELRISRVVGEGMHEHYDITNYTPEPVRFRLALEVDADFADLEETRGERQQRGTLDRRWRRAGDAHELMFDYHAQHRFSHQGERGTAHVRRSLTLRIRNDGESPTRRGRRITFTIELPPQGRWHACLDWIAGVDGEPLPTPACDAFADVEAADQDGALFLREATVFTTAESTTLAGVVTEALARAKFDLAALRLPRFDHGARAWTIAAGAPAYVALFGRDTIVTAGQAAMLGPEMLRGTLIEMVSWQGSERNDWRDEQPGRILHEAHSGPLALLNYKPQARYYGSISSSGLFPAALAQLWQWTGDRDAVAPLIEPALRALRWLDSCTDPRGFHACTTRSRKGVKNQTWKDSDDSIRYEDGTEVAQPVATCEEQGIAYAARMAMAEVLSAFDRRDEARRLRREAQAFKRRFNDAYWMEDEGVFALALDPQGRQVRSIASNALHCVYSGIADDAFVPRIFERLLAPDMFSGWGIRTLSSQHPSYNPYAYHRGTVWPAEHGPFAFAACRHGLHDCLERICRSQFEAASLFDFRRLPECFSGHPRDAEHPFPAIYPAANAPQAWSASTVPALVQAMLGLRPSAPEALLRIDPNLPAWLPDITLGGLRVGNAVASLRFHRGDDGHTSYEVLDLRGELRISTEKPGNGESREVG